MKYQKLNATVTGTGAIAVCEGWRSGGTIASGRSEDEVCTYSKGPLIIDVRDAGGHLFGNTLCDALIKWKDGGPLPALDGQVPTPPAVPLKADIQGAFSRTTKVGGDSSLKITVHNIGPPIGYVQFSFSLGDDWFAHNVVQDTDACPVDFVAKAINCGPTDGSIIDSGRTIIFTVPATAKDSGNFNYNAVVLGDGHDIQTPGGGPHTVLQFSEAVNP